jgi:hypothetical protein
VKDRGFGMKEGFADWFVGVRIGIIVVDGVGAFVEVVVVDLEIYFFQHSCKLFINICYFYFFIIIIIL